MSACDIAASTVLWALAIGYLAAQSDATGSVTFDPRRPAMSVKCSDPRQDRRDNTMAAGRAEGKELARTYT